MYVQLIDIDISEELGGSGGGYRDTRVTIWRAINDELRSGGSWGLEKR